MRGLKYISWGDNTGYAVAAKSYVRALVSSGASLTWTPMLPGPRLRLGFDPYEARTWPEPDLEPLCNSPIDYDVVLMHTVPEYYPYWLQREGAPGRRFYGYTVFELDRIPPSWPAILNRLDGVLVPCAWNVEIFRAAGVTVPIHVVPHLRPNGGERGPSAADRKALRARLGGPSALAGRLVFYTIGSWTIRKDLERTVGAFLEAFTADDPVALVVKTGRLDYTSWRRRFRDAFQRRPVPVRETIRKLLQPHRRPPMVRVIDDETLPDGEIRALHELGDVFLSLTRSEGFGLGAFEAAALGKPVVMTRYGGQLEFLSPERSWLVDYRLVPVRDPAGWAIFAHGDTWPEASIPGAVRALLEIAASPAEALARSAPLASEIAQRFSGDAIVDALRAALKSRAVLDDEASMTTGGVA